MDSASFTNINDPAGVKALLEQLRASDSWQSLATAIDPDPPATTTTAEPAPTSPPPAPSSDHISALLSQLQNPVPAPAQLHVPPRPAPAAAPLRSALKMDVRHVTFQQALPHLSRIAEDDRVRQALTRIRDEQRALERSLADQRAALVRQQQNKVENDRRMARITDGNGISQWAAQSLNSKFENELLDFDRDNVLMAWDGLVAKQQAELEKLGVPTMFVTEVPADREKQLRVIQVLEGILWSGDE